MKTPLRGILLAAALLAAPARSALAIDPAKPALSSSKWKAIATNWSHVCGGNSFVTCASVTLRRQDVGGYTAIEMTVTNESGTNGSWAQTVFTAIGIANLPAPKAYAGWLTVKKGTSNQPGWETGGSVVQGLGLPKTVGGVSTTNGINNGISPTQKLVFTFYVSQIGTNYSNWQLAIHGQRGPNDCSTKLIVNMAGVANQPPPGGLAQACVAGGPPPGPVPEPATLVLLATGLVGIGGAGIVRRRSQAPRANQT